MSNRPVVIQAEAEADINDAYQWYESQRKGLGESFLLCIEEALSRVSRTPLIYAIVYNNIRRVLIHRSHLVFSISKARNTLLF